MTSAKKKKDETTKEASKEKKSGNPAVVEYEKGLKALHAGRYQNAMTAFDQIETKFPEELEILNRARTLKKVCARKLAEASPEKRTDSASAEELFTLGVFYHNNNEYPKALEFYEKALKSEGQDSSHVYFAMAASEAGRGHHDQALKHLSKAISINPDNRFLAFNDPDFAPMAELEEFQRLVDSSD